MGEPLAGRLLYRNRVFGTNRTRSKACALIDKGLIWRDTPREAAAAADVVFSMVDDDGALAAVTAGPDGILAGLQPGALYIDMSTVSPSASRELSKRVWAAGATMVDAPVSGGVAAAETGTLAIMVGGTEAGYRAAEALLLRLGRTVTHVGGNGQALLLDLADRVATA
jgi:3-hydroxyisobutyrate dehydrogenase-like beta-hydroxyacid dehydrogenase